MSFKNAVFSVMMTMGVLQCGASMAADNISVSVNGITYQCGTGAPQQQLRTFCKCAQNTIRRDWHWKLELRSVNLVTGEEKYISTLFDHGTRDDSPQACEDSIQNHPVCR